MKLKNNGKLNFIIDLFLDLDNYMSGGLIALHRLAYELANRGHNVYIFCKPHYPHDNITQIRSKINSIKGHKYTANFETFSFILNNTISIYPEHSINNKFNTTHNVRWIMYHTTPKDEKNFKEGDYIFNYGNFYTYTNREDGKLRVLDYNLDKFFIEDNIKRKGYCFINGKQTPKNYKEILSKFTYTDITEIKHDTNLNTLRKEFNKYEYFLTFDQKTYLTTAASLCGCKSIVLDPFSKNKNYISAVNDGITNNAYTDSDMFDTPLTPIEYKLENPEHMFGLAYGIEDLKWAEDTIHLVRDHIKNLEIMNNQKIDRFVKFWENKVNKK